jgi:hypothetical protein
MSQCKNSFYFFFYYTKEGKGFKCFEWIKITPILTLNIFPAGKEKRLIELNVSVAEMTNNMHRFAPLLYSIYRFLHVSTVVCHHQGISESV